MGVLKSSPRGLALHLATFIAFGATLADDAAPRATLLGRAVLPAATFAPGDTSGTRIGKGPIHGQKVPFADRQPVGGVSSIVAAGAGEYLALADNGFGKLENSADFLLCVYVLRPNLRTKSHRGGGSIEVVRRIELRDPDRKVPFTITHHFDERRRLTGADFDPESLQQAADGSLWIGEEFGPYLLHFSSEGNLLDPPYPLPDPAAPSEPLRSPQNPRFAAPSAVRMMNAALAHARGRGGERTPVCSPSSRLVSVFDLRSLRDAGFPVVVWTVNDKDEMLRLMKAGVDGIITDRPDLLREAAAEFDADGDGKSGDFLLEDGSIDPEKFDAQGHRGGRNLRPENTLPAMEAALDERMTTLECDAAITRDGVAVLRHDPFLETFCCRRADGVPYGRENRVRILDLPLATIRAEYIADRLLPHQPWQKNDLALSPVSTAFAKERGLPHPYAVPTVDELFDFAEYYASYYAEGPGASHAEAKARAANARRARFNIETKLDPRSEKAGETVGPVPFATAIAEVIQRRGLLARADIQSFDFRTLLFVQEKYPAIRTVYLVDAAALPEGPGAPREWLGGMIWPAPLDNGAARVRTSAGIEGMALGPDGKRLYPMLEKPLGGEKENWVFEFDTEGRAFAESRYRYSMDPRATAIGEFQLTGPLHGIVIERDDSEGRLDGFKAVYLVRWEGPDSVGRKRLLCDLLAIDDREGLSGSGGPTHIGLGGRFAMPFMTIESVWPVSPGRLLLVNDNNFPFSVGRHVGAGLPDDTEFVEIELEAAPLAVPGSSP